MIAETVSIAPIASKLNFHKYHTKNNDCKWHRNKLYASRVFLELTLYTSVRSALYSLFRCRPLPITRLSIFIFALWLVTAALCAAAAVHQEHFTASHNPTYTHTGWPTILEPLCLWILLSQKSLKIKLEFFTSRSKHHLNIETILLLAPLYRDIRRIPHHTGHIAVSEYSARATPTFQINNTFILVT